MQFQPSAPYFSHCYCLDLIDILSVNGQTGIVCKYPLDDERMFFLLCQLITCLVFETSIYCFYLEKLAITFCEVLQSLTKRRKVSIIPPALQSWLLLVVCQMTYRNNFFPSKMTFLSFYLLS